MATDPFEQFKAAQREGWALFAPVAAFTVPPAAMLVDYARVRAGQEVLDVGCGTGVVALTAARRGARVRGVDLSPVLLEEARKNAALMDAREVEFVEGDVEALPFPDASFDVVLSQFGHMFAPRPELAVREMLRVLRPGGRIAFSTWPPELLIGRTFALVAQYLPLPPGIPSPAQWGDPDIVRTRLGDGVIAIEFDRADFLFPALSPQHYRAFMERNLGPLAKLVATLADRRETLREFRTAYEALVEKWFAGNVVRQGFLMTRANRR